MVPAADRPGGPPANRRDWVLLHTTVRPEQSDVRRIVARRGEAIQRAGNHHRDAQHEVRVVGDRPVAALEDVLRGEVLTELAPAQLRRAA